MYDKFVKRDGGGAREVTGNNSDNWGVHCCCELEWRCVNLPEKKQLCREVFGFYESLFVDGTTSKKIANLSDLTFSVWLVPTCVFGARSTM